MGEAFDVVGGAHPAGWAEDRAGPLRDRVGRPDPQPQERGRAGDDHRAGAGPSRGELDPKAVAQVIPALSPPSWMHNPEPSQAVKAAAAAVGIRFLDHLILGDAAPSSFKANGLL